MDKLTIYDVEGESHLVELVNGTPVLHLKELREVPVFPFSMRVINSFNDSYFLLEGRYHRENGPAIEYAIGNKFWYVNGKCHRLDGPAIEYANGNKSWYVNGKRHRLDGPAIEYANGDKFWYVNGKRHRLDGPAREYANGKKLWWINGEKVKESDYPAAVEGFIDSKVLV